MTLLPLAAPHFLQPEEVFKAMCGCGLSFPICEMGIRTTGTSRQPKGIMGRNQPKPEYGQAASMRAGSMGFVIPIGRQQLPP